MVGNTLLNAHVTDGRVHGLQEEKTFQQATVDFSTLFLFKRLPSQDTNAFSDSSYGTELGLPLFLLLLTRLDRLAPYCFFTFLAGTHNYLAGIHNYFFTIRTTTTVPQGLPLGGWYCTISFLFIECAAKIDGPFGLPMSSIMPSLALPALSVRNFPSGLAMFAFCFSFVRMIVLCVFLTLPACSLI